MNTKLCSPKKSTLCKNNECTTCFNRSFASHPKSQYWDYVKNSDLIPRNVAKGSDKFINLNCNECNHNFNIQLKRVGLKNAWCQYCSNRKICKNKDCVKCFNTSFSSLPQSKYWHTEKNGNLTPRNIFKSANKKYWFYCDVCKHNFHKSPNGFQTKGGTCPYCAIPSKLLCGNDNCSSCFNRSFKSHPKSEFWNYEKNNNENPSLIFKGTLKKYWFSCSICSHEFKISLNSITNKHKECWCPYCSIPVKKMCDKSDCKHCFQKSFASHEYSNNWNYTLNTKTPREVFKNSNTKYWFTCQDCQHEFSSNLGSIVNGCRCPYHKKLLCDKEDCQHCFNNSFASHPKSEYWDFVNNIKKPREVFKSSGKKYWFVCDSCPHSFKNSLDHISRGRWCPYCCKPCKKLCDKDDCQHCFKKSFASHSKSKYWHTDKNKLTPRQCCKFKNQKYWFTCNDCNNEFYSSLGCISSGTWCPICVNKTEKKLYNWLLIKYPTLTIKKEFKVDWCKNKDTGRHYRYDFYIKDYKLIIELDGIQHFEYVKHFNNNVEKRQQIDTFKIKCANEHGISIIRILQDDVYYDKTNWQKLLQEKIKMYDEVQNIYLGNKYSNNIIINV